MAKSHWAGIPEILRNYTPFGAKPEKISPIFKGNFILDNLTPLLAEDKLEELQSYSFVLYRLIKWIVDILNTRKSDILWRHANQRAAIKKRIEIINTNKKIEKERQKALEDAIRQFNGEPEKPETAGNKGEEEEEEEEVEEKPKKNEPKLDADGNPIVFNEEEFLQLFDQEHPKTPEPDEVKLDEDNDFDLEEEALPTNEEEEEGEDGEEDNKNNQNEEAGGDEE